MNVANLLVRAARSYASRPAVSLGERVLSDYATLGSRASRLGWALRERRGLRPGDRVAIIMKNSPAYVETLFGIWHAGLVAVPVNAKLALPEFRYILEHSGAKLCFASPGLAGQLHGVVETLPSPASVIETGSDAYADLFTGDSMALTPAAPDDVAWLFYTSGTTGTPKGAMLTHRNLAMMTSGYFSDVDTIASRDAIIHAAPMSHGSGMYILPHVAAAALNVVPESGGFDPEEIFALIERFPGVSFFAAPTMVRRLTDSAARQGADTENLKTIVYGGGPMYLEDLKDAIAAFGNKFAQIFGQGESPMTITAMSKALHADATCSGADARLASVGMPQTLVEVRVGDETGNTLPPGDVGEVLVRGDIVMQGYWEAPEATERAMAGGWLHTGDTGYFDEDGFLTLKDRTKDVIISGGTNIYPREIEEVLLCHEGVAEVSIVGRPNREWGEEVVAFVVPEASARVTRESLDAHCLEHIARFKRPREYRFAEKLPKNAYGKVLKTELRRELERDAETARSEK
ncbi:MAG: AMP-binding protein [Ectothiorhodospiraceae bacterium]